MHRPLLLVVLLLSAPVAADTIHVPTDFRSIQSAIDAASGGDVIVVAPGTYLETIDLLGKAITIQSMDPFDTDVIANTVIDGQRTGTVVTCESDEPPSTVIDGLTITGGMADFGGGIRCVDSRPTIRRCIIRNNAGSSGGGMYNGSGARPKIQDCSFHDNTTFGGGDGAGMLNDESHPTISSTAFNDNVAECCGGAMLNTGSSSPVILGCTFIGNTTTSSGSPGGAIVFEGGSPTVDGSLFIDNVAGKGGAINASDAKLDISGSVFSDNSAHDGGGVFVFGGIVTITGCSFESNTTALADGGGGVYARLATVNISDCMFTMNSADFAGGAVYLRCSGGTISSSSFAGNTTIDQGGALFNEDSSPLVEHCTFQAGNTSDFGGAIANDAGSSPSFHACAIVGNHADADRGAGGGVLDIGTGSQYVNCLIAHNTASWGAGAYVSEGSASFVNTTIADNTATSRGGGLAVLAASVDVANGIIWGNTEDGTSSDTAQIDSRFGTTVVNFACVQDGWDGAGGAGIVVDDPVFTAPRRNDYHLENASPCIDAGDDDAVPPGTLVDLDGNDRFVATVDLGAYERQTCPADIDADGDVGFTDLLAVWRNGAGVAVDVRKTSTTTAWWVSPTC